MEAKKLRWAKRGVEVAYHWPNEPNTGVSRIEKITSVTDTEIRVTTGSGLRKHTDRFSATTGMTKGGGTLAIRPATDADRREIAERNERGRLIAEINRVKLDGLPTERLRAVLVAMKGEG